MYNIEIVRFALLNPFGAMTAQKIRKILEHSLEVIQSGELLYNFKDKDQACFRLLDIIIAKSANDEHPLGNNDRQLIKLVLENKALFNENISVLADIREKSKLFDKTVFDFETIEEYKAALEAFIMFDGSEIEAMEHHIDVMEDALMNTDGAETVMLVDESGDLTDELDVISEMLDDEFDDLCDMEQRQMLNGKELPTKGHFAIVERTLGIGATDWELWTQGGATYLELGDAIDHKPSNYSRGYYSKEFEVVNLADPTWKQSLIENDENEYFVMRRELTRGGTDATEWEKFIGDYKTWGEADDNCSADFDNYQFIIASHPKEKEEKKVDTRRRIFNFGD